MANVYTIKEETLHELADAIIEKTNATSFKIGDIPSIIRSTDVVATDNKKIINFELTKESDVILIGIDLVFQKNADRKINLLLDEDFYTLEASSNTENSFYDSLSFITPDKVSAGSHCLQIITNNAKIINVFITNEISYNMPILDKNDFETEDGEIINVTASVTAHNTQPYLAFDGIYNIGGNCWHPDDGSNKWLQIKFPSKMRINEFTMRNRTTNIECPRDVELLCSNDGENWIKVSEFIFAEAGGAGQSKTITISNDAYKNDGYSFFRWNLLTANNGYSVIASIELDEIYRFGNDLDIRNNYSISYTEGSLKETYAFIKTSVPEETTFKCINTDNNSEITPTSNPYTFIIKDAGNYKIEAQLNGVTKDKTYLINEIGYFDTLDFNSLFE